MVSITGSGHGTMVNVVGILPPKRAAATCCLDPAGGCR
jgi:hypothetical protein